MALLEMKNLKTFFTTKRGTVKAVNGVSYNVESGKTLGVVGESGSGKSVAAMSMLQLLDGNGYIESGEILFEGVDLTKLSIEDMYHVRGNDISVIFQEPMTSLNPVFTVERQLSEPFMIHQGMNKKEAAAHVVEMLADVKIPNPDVVAKQYPHQLSGGMRQRVMIAMALACRPKLLIADEPTTALDVTIQAQILDMMRSLQKKQGTSMILITHDLGVVAEMCDHCAVMYAGELVEYGTVEEIFDNPKHPYTKALYQSIPSLDKDVDRLHVVPGMVTDPSNLPEYCSFADRCEAKCDLCEKADPKMIRLNEEHCVKCLQYTKEWEGKINE